MNKFLLVLALFVTAAIAQADPTGVDPGADAIPANILQSLKNQQYKQVEEELKNLVREQPENYRLSLELGKALVKTGYYDEGLTYLEHAKSLNEKFQRNDASIYNAVGWARFLAGDSAAAKTEIQKTLQSQNLSKSTRETALVNMGLIYTYEKDLDAAQKYFSDAATNYDNPLARKNLRVIDAMKEDAKRQAPVTQP